VRSIRRILIEVAEAKGLPKYNPHLLRHACASHLHDHGAPLQAIAALLGHAKLSTAQMYTRVSVGRMMQTYNMAHPHAKTEVSKNGAGFSQIKRQTEHYATWNR
jgi:integrase/recombinase XerC